ncbi:MAG TPA: hypothetical protein VGJ56_06770 [Reyranella sp.]|jgi:hypothetical protein
MHESAFETASARLLTIVAATMAVAGCASVIEGRSQHISVATNPPGAHCGLYREQGIRIATVESTPGDAFVEKTKADIWIVCVRQGYQPVAFRNHSGISGAAFVNVIGGVFTLGISTAIGAAVDSSNGSDNKYQSPVNITMVAGAPDQSVGSLPASFNGGQGIEAGQQQAVALAPSSAPPPAADHPASAPTTAQPAAAVVPSVPRPAAARASGTLPAPGIWECGLRAGNKHTYRLQFVVGGDHSIIITNYNNSPATIVQQEPLTMTANNPRGDRPMNIVWNTDNTMEISGPNSKKPDTTFHDSGACTKV